MVLCCPVCGLPLVRGDHALRCAAGHSFDVARQGYVNLLTVSQKHSKSPGDTREQVQARRAFLAGGYYRPIAETLCRLAAPLGPDTIVDAGCGEGYYLAALQRRCPGPTAWGWTSPRRRFAAPPGPTNPSPGSRHGRGHPSGRRQLRSGSLPVRPDGGRGILPCAPSRRPFSTGFGRAGSPAGAQVRHLSGALSPGEDFSPGFAGIFPCNRPKPWNFPSRWRVRRSRTCSI